ncbi:hypothetical protein FHX42_004287 [Saccharopolyspora lacisalsi]|uniref:Excreted virulence factor EspC, type VII ESX diderm n=1 Tax=Halosaccharopolyspora lacisalsi TaxID=1000566 RepID=A0A839E7Q7_9PSEU|nr:hypothetical protein [Halosaccharopolyspora lacisalsi]MBA8826908.1 hypothetical protein [Halosaccharopolyspora lacisalsi]
MTGFRGDVDRLSRQAEEFTELARRARRIAEHARADSSGSCWGTDEIGERFAAAHQPRAERALERLDALPGRLAGMGEKFAEAARTYRGVDEANAEHIGRSDR